MNAAALILGGAVDGADRGADEDRDHDSAHPGPVVHVVGRGGLRLHQQAGYDPADRGDIANREVDLAEQQDEDLADGQDAEDRALAE